MTSGKTRNVTLNSLAAQLRLQAVRSVMLHSAVAARLGIAVTDFNCINVLSLDGAQTPGRLAERIGITRGGAVTAMIDRLERAGFVRRRRDSGDRRRVLVELDSAVAADAISPMFADLGTAVAEYLDGYTVEELRMLQRFTSDVNTLVSQATEKLRRAQLDRPTTGR